MLEEFVEVSLDEVSINAAENVDNLGSLIRSVQAQSERNAPPGVHPGLQKIPEVVDDYIRNYLVKRGFYKTLEIFETEWYALFGTDCDPNTAVLSDVYVQLAHALDEVESLRDVLKKDESIIKQLTTLCMNSKKERDFHRINHNRAIQEKSTITTHVRELQEHVSNIDPTLRELQTKYESTQRDKMLLRIERDKLAVQVTALEEQIKERNQLAADSSALLANVAEEESVVKKKSTKQGISVGFVWPPDKRSIPQISSKSPSNAFGWSSRNAFKTHSRGVTHLAIHPQKPVVACSSDDGTWKLVSLPQGDSIITGEGHKGWISGIAMHPKGTMVATASGDKTLKLWDLGKGKCRITLKGHTEGVWCVDFQDTGSLIASGSIDNTARIWDAEVGKCRQTLRGHVDAVNSVCWQTGSNLLWTGSGDKTISLWDARANVCVQTFYGHRSSITGISVPPSAEIVASCDTEGNAVLWDVKMIQQKQSFVCGTRSANSVSFDGTENVIAVASDDASIYLFSTVDEKNGIFKGHDDSVQHATFDPQTNGYLVSCGSDGTKKESTIRVKRDREITDIYLRNDLGCGSIQCQECLKTAFQNTYKPTIDVKQPIMVPDVNILLYGVKFLESSNIKNVVILESTLKDIIGKNNAVYNMIILMSKDPEKQIFIFSNDRHQSTYSEKKSGETQQEYHSRLVRIASMWIAKHVSKLDNKITNSTEYDGNLYLVTHDADLQTQCAAEARNEEQNISNFHCVPLRDYLAKVIPADDPLLDMALEMKNVDVDTNITNLLKQFTEHLSQSRMEQGINCGRYRKGKLNVSDVSPFVGTIRTKDWVVNGKEVDSVFIYNKYLMNRAFHGDIVAVEIIDPTEWSNTKDPVPAGISVEEAITLGHKPCGHVIGILTTGNRQFCGSVSAEDIERCKNSTGVVSVLFQPKSSKVPSIRMATRQLSEIADKRLLVVVERWSKESSHPQGRYVEILGKIGNRDTETKVILIEHDIPHYDFSRDVYNCLPKGQWSVEDSEVAKRLDIRDLCICSVDPLGCRDIDDALHYRVLKNGNVEVGVHIADVTHFVMENSAMDLEARKRSTSTYLVDRRINMLPQLLTENLCSIVQDEDRYAFSIIWEFKKEAIKEGTREATRPLKTWFGKTIIRSQAALYYGDAQKMIDDKEDKSELATALKGLMDLSRLLSKKRNEDGALFLASQEFKFKVEKDHANPTDMQDYETFEANSMVEEWMLFANAAAAAKIQSAFPQWALLRRLQPPSPSSFDNINEALYGKLGVTLDCTTSKALNQSLDKCVDSKDPFFNKLIRILTPRCLRQAEYISSGVYAYEEFFHYAIAMPIYTHFTSPIRRYADVIVHRQLGSALGIMKINEEYTNPELMGLISDNINHKHEQAQKAGRDSQNLFTGFFLREYAHKGTKIPVEDGYIVRITKSYIVTLVPKYGQEGKIRRKDIPKNGDDLHLLDKVRVKIGMKQEGDAMRTRMEYHIISDFEENGQQEPPGAKKAKLDVGVKEEEGYELEMEEGLEDILVGKVKMKVSRTFEG